MAPGRKRKRRGEGGPPAHPADAEGTRTDEALPEECADGYAAVELLLGSAAKQASEAARRAEDGDPPPPIVLTSQVYTVVNDRTSANRCLQELVEQGSLRRVWLHAAGEEAYVKLVDLKEEALREREREREAGQGDEEAAWAFDAFIEKLLEGAREPMLAEGDARERLLASSRAGSGTAERALGLLQRHGLLARESASDLLCLAFPTLGKAVTSVIEGRNELLAFLQRRRRRHVTREEVLKRAKLRKSWFGVRIAPISCLLTPVPIL